MFKANNKDTRTPVFLLTVKAPVFIFNFEHISHIFLILLLWALNMCFPARYGVSVKKSAYTKKPNVLIPVTSHVQW